MRRLLAIVCVSVLAVSLAACGRVADPGTADNNGVYVQAGPLTYQLQISRQLNPYDTEDKQYLAGVPAKELTLAPTQLWYGVFIWAKNQTHNPQATTDNFDIVDTQGNKYYPVALNPSLNGYAWTAQQLAPGAVEPGADTEASFGPTQGGLLLFKLDDSVYDNRPLTLEIRSPTNGKRWATISLDL